MTVSEIIEYITICVSVIILAVYALWKIRLIIKMGTEIEDEMDETKEEYMLRRVAEELKREKEARKRGSQIAKRSFRNWLLSKIK